MFDVGTAVLVMAVSECRYILLTSLRIVCSFITVVFRYILRGSEITNTYFAKAFLLFLRGVKTDHSYLPRDERSVSLYTNYLPVSSIIDGKI